MAFLILIFGIAIYACTIGSFCAISILCMLTPIKNNTGQRKILLIVATLLVGIFLGVLLGSYFMLKFFGEYLSFINLI